MSNTFITPPSIQLLTTRYGWCWLCEPRCVDRNIGFDRRELVCRTAIEPCHGPFERQFHSRDLAIIAIVHERHDTPNRRVREPHQARPQPGFDIETQRRSCPVGGSSVNDIDLPTIN